MAFSCLYFKKLTCYLSYGFGFQSHLFAEKIQGRQIRACSRLIAKDLFDDFVDLPVKDSEWNLSRTSLFAQSTIRASACHVDGPDQMKQGDLGRESSRSHEVRVLQAAFGAEADRTNIPAPVALDALLKLIHPPGKTLPGFKAVQVPEVGMERDAQGLFDSSGHFLLKRGGGRNREDFDSPLFNLIPCLENFQSPLVSLLHRKANGGFRMQAHQLPRYFLKRIKG